MDAMIVVADGRASCRRLRDLKKGNQVVTGMRGIRVLPESKERNRLGFAFMSNDISSERQLETAVRQIGIDGTGARRGTKVSWWLGRWLSTLEADRVGG
jgi:hypothetical protein